MGQLFYERVTSNSVTVTGRLDAGSYGGRANKIRSRVCEAPACSEGADCVLIVLGNF